MSSAHVRIAVHNRRRQGHGSTAHRTVFDIFLILDTEVDNYLDAFSAIGAVHVTGLSDIFQVEVCLALPNAPCKPVAASP